MIGGEESRDEVLGVISRFLSWYFWMVCITDELGMLHHERRTTGRSDCMVYGLATDGYYFHFVVIDNDSQVRLKSLFK